MSQQPNESLVILKPLLAAMARPTSNTSDEETAWLEKGLRAAWAEKSNRATITTVANWLKAQSNAVCQNLALLLYSYTGEEQYP